MSQFLGELEDLPFPRYYVRVSRSEDDRVNEARRRLLRSGAASVPAILSVVVVRNAQTTPSCNPVTMGRAMGAADMMQTMGPMGNSDMT